MPDDRVTIRRQDGCRIITLYGEVDHYHAASLAQPIQAATETAGPIVIDLGAVSFLDSAGLRLLDRAVRMCAERHCPVRIVAPDPGAVRFTIELIGFRPELLAGTTEQALADALAELESQTGGPSTADHRS